jgi:ABC-type transport system involved in cytochrome c biogenesis permease component
MIKLHQTFILAQSLDAALQEGGNILYKIAFLVGVVVIMGGGWAIRRGEADTGKMAIIGGAIIALAALIMGALFDAAGMSGAKIDLGN